MIIEDSTTPILLASSPPASRLPLALGMAVTIATTTLPLLFIFISSDKPTGTLLSPLPDGEIAEITITPEATQAASSAIIAAPEEAMVIPTGETKVDANAKKTLATIPAGKNEIVIRDERIFLNTYIYIVPVSGTNSPITVKAKGEGYFIAKVSLAPASDLLFDYYLVEEQGQ